MAEVEPEKLGLSLSALVTPTLYEPLVAEIGDVTCSEADALAPEAMLSADVFEDTDHPFGAKVCKLKLDVPQATSLLVTEIVYVKVVPGSAVWLCDDVTVGFAGTHC